MLARRTFTFASLATALLPEVANADPSPLQQLANQPPPLGARFALTRDGDSLTVKMTVLNPTDQPVDVMVARGSRPGPALQAWLEVGTEQVGLAETTPVDRRELMSRIGPMPTWVALAARAEAPVNPYQFALPSGCGQDTVGVLARCDTRTGEADVRATGLSWSIKGV